MLNTADVCVNPDVANEMNDKSTMNKIMEYMALGKPIVQFDLTEGRYSAQRRVVVRAEERRARSCARRSSSCSTIRQRRAEMGEFGRRRVENELEWRHEAPKLLAAYEALWHYRRSFACRTARRSPMTVTLAVACSGRA